MTPEEILPTDRGDMTVDQIVDHLRYASYRHNRNLGLTAERLAGFFGEIPGAEMEAKYRKERHASE